MSTTAPAQRFCEVIKQARLALDPAPTQVDLAGRLGVTQPAISNWEGGNGFPEHPSLVRLADELCLDLGDLVRLIAAEQNTQLEAAS